MRINLTNHAKKQLMRRNLTEKEVGDVLKDPQKV